MREDIPCLRLARPQWTLQGIYYLSLRYDFGMHFGDEVPPCEGSVFSIKFPSSATELNGILENRANPLSRRDRTVPLGCCFKSWPSHPVLLYWLLSLTRTQHQQKHGDGQITSASERPNQDKCESLINRSTSIQTSDPGVCCWNSILHSSAWFQSSMGFRTVFLILTFVPFAV